ncbi:MAG: protein-disulfide reductase DsbD N-terminal domain-containing protein [Acidobacteria bacterium]|nr:protein-disulfide reductase DsbD N-terminal domain-containing protein [Acidobacteriota bacterium]
MALALYLCVPLIAQQIQLPKGILKKKPHVTFLADDQTVTAGRATTLALHFTIEPGFHINSHTPRALTLIPTKLAVQDDNTFTVKSVDFPRGHDYAFAASPNDKLDVYTGDFVLTAHLTAKRGPHTLKGLLHYQACDTASCYPPSTLPVELHFTAR